MKHTTPVSFEDVNAVIEEPEIDFGVDERTEVEVRSAMSSLKAEMGEDRFNEMGMAFLLKMEPRLRQTMPANSRAIQVLDEYHRNNG